ncbi:hypothetical protein BDP55DRAFT_666873 [Colletotrichum godetiae]|uniref:Uncharacterized protein n=1 Tax=Colletotrichum godetiae TaxID=1209918 RepID=A0AAJ0AIK7_9PEZI|nr:uncharacterized protein BDP55DRAFT_666873 [Colletotrichum godetiae]KAK1674561.1 hypothetical protein BDP55DRAFT_666873 [Colletotrichum godetiae]
MLYMACPAFSKMCGVVKRETSHTNCTLSPAAALSRPSLQGENKTNASCSRANS